MQVVSDFATGYGFALDDFQLAGVQSLAQGRSVLVAAPTGAGKTVVGEFAAWQALNQGGKCFYTTPIKALSNQKYTDLTRRHGAANVGLLTGDNAINSEASVIVMTTEVLRNMLYEASPSLRGLHFVVLDEVHYLADRERGAVWEEVIVQLPAAVTLACLSATVSNAEEFGAWLAKVRHGCDVVISEHRPVPLEHHYAVGERIYPTFRVGRAGGRRPQPERASAARQARAGVPNPDVVLLERRAGVSNRVSGRGRPQPTGPRLRPPRRSDLIEALGARRWLPAIYFLFSREGCDAAVGQLLGDGVRLTTTDEQRAIRRVVDERTATLPDEDLQVLGYGRWATALEAGIAAHHAGMVPVFKETVETLFAQGLLKVCFATETLALGINMPARTVVIERLEKWNGQRHELLTPGQFTQLTGRAGRRGLDRVGHAVVVYQRDVDFPTVASLVGRRTEPLVSRFVPSYNMAVNLLRRHTRPEAERLLAASFAQYQADATVGDDQARIARNREALEGYARNLHSDRGDFAGYWELRRRLSRLESEGARQRRRRSRADVADGLAALQPGDVVALPAGGRRPDLVAVVERTGDGEAPWLRAVTADRRLVKLGLRDFDTPPEPAGRVRLPTGHYRSAPFRKRVAEDLRRLPAPTPTPAPARADADAAEQVAALRAAVRTHPVHGDEGRPDLERWAHRHDDLSAATLRMEHAVRRRTGSLVRRFDRILDVLTQLGYLSGGPEDPRPTPAGLRLAALYVETDLVLAESLRDGLLGGLPPPDLAAVASAFTFTTRSREPRPPVYPTAAVRRTLEEVEAVWRRLAAVEEDASLPVTRPPDAGFAQAVWLWAGGADLDDALGATEATAGDFVRDIKQVADLLRQLRDAVDDAALASTAARASRGLVRGVVAHTGL